MKCTLTAILLVITTHLFAQNLVLNPSFENYSNCPTDSCQISYANSWYNVYGNTSYFNVCGSNGFSIPNNKYGSQSAATGNGYAEFNFLANYVIDNDVIGGQLSSPLNIGQKYYVSYKISLAGKSTVAANRMGITFSTIKHNSPCNQSNPYYTSLRNFHTDSIISDTANWTRVSGTFIADSNYKYIEIGLLDIQDSLSFHYVNGASGWQFAFYYLDDVCVSTDSLTCNTLADIIENDFNNNIDIFPNPASDEIQITGNKNSVNSIEICNLLGEKIYSYTGTIYHFPITINIKNIPSGLYFVKIKTEKRELIKKFVKE